MSQPVHELKDGCLQVGLRRNTSTSGSTYYTATPQRSFERGDGTWREIDSRNGDDLLAMAELLREAYAWTGMQKRADTKAAKGRDKVTAR